MAMGVELRLDGYLGLPRPNLICRDGTGKILRYHGEMLFVTTERERVSFNDREESLCSRKRRSWRCFFLRSLISQLYFLILSPSLCFTLFPFFQFVVSFPVRLAACLPTPPSSCSFLSTVRSFLGTAPLLPSGVTAPTDSGWSLAGTLVHSDGQRSDSGRDETKTPEPASQLAPRWQPTASAVRRCCYPQFVRFDDGRPRTFPNQLAARRASSPPITPSSSHFFSLLSRRSGILASISFLLLSLS